MTNRELDYWILKNVMEWKQSSNINPVFWHPTTSISDAFQVVEKMRKGNYLFELKGYSDGWRVWIVMPKEGSVGEFNDSLPLAICHAVKRAMENK